RPAGLPLQQPSVDVRDGTKRAEVPVLVAETGGNTRNPAAQPLPVVERDHEVLAAVDDQDRYPDLSRLESPVADEGEVVVDPAVDGAGDATGHPAEQELAHLPTEQSGVDR